MSQVIFMFFVGVFLGFGAAIVMMNNLVKRIGKQSQINKERLERACKTLEDAKQLMDQYEQGNKK